MKITKQQRTLMVNMKNHYRESIITNTKRTITFRGSEWYIVNDEYEWVPGYSKELNDLAMREVVFSICVGNTITIKYSFINDRGTERFEIEKITK